MNEPSKLQSTVAAIEKAQSKEHVLDVVEAQLKKLAASHILISGMPMPNRSIEGLAYRFRWPDERNSGIERTSLSAKDSALMLGLYQTRSFVWTISKDEGKHSELFAALGGQGQVIVVPVNSNLPFQGLVLGAGPNLTVTEFDLSPLEVVCDAAFRRLIALGTVAIQRPGELSKRERRVLELTAAGMTASDVAELLKISQRTVHAHLQNASSKLNTSNKTHTVVEALRYGQINVNPR